nr:EAL domain-containing protein [uncultured Butyrivibrio sp.]
MKHAREGVHNRIFSVILKRAITLLICATLMLIPVATAYASENDQNTTDTEGKVVRVGWYESAYCYTDQFGRKTGMAYEYQQKIAAYTGWTYEYVNGTWPELLKKLKDGEIDLLSDVSYKGERIGQMLYSTLPMGTESYYIFIKSGNNALTLDDVKTFEGKRFAVDKDSIQEDCLRSWAEQNEIEIELIQNLNQSPENCIKMLDSGFIDAYVTMDTYGKNDVLSPVCKIGTSDYYFAVNKDREDLLKELNHAMCNIQNEDPFYNQRMYQKYIWSVSVNSYPSEDELEYLAKHNTIRIGYRDNYLPFCASEGGELYGTLKDYLDYASTCLHGVKINFEAVPYKTTEESLEAMDRGEVDAVFPLSMNSYDSENAGLFITDQVMDTEIYVVVKTKGINILDNSDNTVVLLKGNINFDNFVKDNYPEYNIIWREPLEEVYATVARGEADCAIVNGNRINTTDTLRRRHKLSLLTTGKEMSFSFAVKRNNGILYSILNKTANLIDESTIDASLSRYSNNTEKVSFTDYLNDNIPSVLAALAIVASLILFLLLQKVKSDKKAKDRQKLIAATERDPLTKLYTRNFFFEYANRLYKDNPDKKMDAIVLNIEQFHVVNALYGWSFGDIVLRALGDEISKFIKEKDGIACRTQADRFDIYCSTDGDYHKLFDRFQQRIDSCAQNVNLRIRMGIMPWQDGMEPIQLFDRARTACTMVRGGQKTRLMVFSEDMRIRELLDHRLLNDLKRAVETREFLVYYQPKFNIQTNPPTLCSAEALVRWNHSELGMIPPGDFISLFEKHGQIGVVDKYVWAEAARQIAEWKKEYGVILPVSVNLSRVDIFDPESEEIIEKIVQDAGIGRANLHLEVTESAYTENEDLVIDVVKKFRDKGYHIEMDDFGTGYSSLNMLSHMPIDVLKLDRSFIKDIESDKDSGKNVRLVELILDIAKSLKLVVVAEGVENDAQCNFLKKRGCEIVQGYYFSPPLPADEFERKFIKK